MFRSTVTAAAMASVLCVTAGLGQTAPQPSSTPTAPPLPMPAYEVATIKPQDGNGYMMPLRVYIQSAFAIPLNTTGRVIGPDWINTTGYVIQGKPPDSIRDAMQTMTPQQRSKEDQLMHNPCSRIASI